jgi:hypothetical protein
VSFDQIHVHGPCDLRWGTSSTDLQRVGISEDGADITIMYGREHIHSDQWGPFVPADVLVTGKMARITITLVHWDAAQLEIVRGGFRNRIAGEVQSADIGALMIQSGLYNQLLLQGTARTAGVLEAPYRFEVCFIDDQHGVRVSTKHGRATLSFTALPHSGNLFVRV